MTSHNSTSVNPTGDDYCALSKRVDGPRHSWRFDGDDPYVECSFCGEYRDALTGRVIRAGRLV